MKDILSSKNFCILPFVHAHISTTGQSQVCCMSEESFGNVKELGISNVYSKDNQKLTSFRKNMLDNGLPDSCINCSRPESYGNTSHRITSNKMFGHLLNGIDDLVNNEKVFLWDVRFSNLCNLKCRMCGPHASTRIAEEQKTDTVLIKPFNEYNEFFEFFIKNIDHVTEFYFCGGEPLMMDEHYRVLDLLVEHKKFDVAIRYNSNLTTLKLKDKNVIDYWQKFKNVKVSASIDAGWEQLSYIRHGADWDTILDNLSTIRYNVSHVELILGVAVNILNAFHIFRMYKYLVNRHLINPNEIYFIPVGGNMSLSCLPKLIKEKVSNHWQEELNEINEQNVIDSARALLKEMNSSDKQYMLSNFINEVKDLDKKRNENFAEVFPELKEILNG
jgi:MoaA/NifB/PqqE/SkfB family radical SAM enzyme